MDWITISLVVFALLVGVAGMAAAMLMLAVSSLASMREATAHPTPLNTPAVEEKGQIPLGNAA